jgi:hypothetical protein
LLGGSRGWVWWDNISKARAGTLIFSINSCAVIQLLRQVESLATGIETVRMAASQAAKKKKSAKAQEKASKETSCVGARTAYLARHASNRDGGCSSAI